jgi:hypothetical protein
MAPFDPYYQWLGIPETERPISKYRLLALVDFEADRGVIGAAAEQRTIYLRTMQSGEHTVLVAELLNEVSQARVCLLDGKSKSRYDTQLRSDLEPAPEQDPLAFAAEELAAISSRPTTRSRGGKPFWHQPWSAAAGGAFVMLLIMLLFGSGDEPKESGQGNSPKNTSPTSKTPPTKTLPPSTETAAQSENYFSEANRNRVWFRAYLNKNWFNDIKEEFTFSQSSEGVDVTCNIETGYPQKLMIFPVEDVTSRQLIAEFTLKRGRCGFGWRPQNLEPRGSGADYDFQPGQRYRIRCWLEKGVEHMTVNGKPVEARYGLMEPRFYCVSTSTPSSILFHEFHFIPNP